MAAAADGADLEASLLSFEKLDRASPDLWPEQLPGVAEFAASFKSPITSSPPKWMAELENDDIDMLKELGSLTTANLMEKVRGLQNLAYQLGLDECGERCLFQDSFPHSTPDFKHLQRSASGEFKSSFLPVLGCIYCMHYIFPCLTTVA
ncbi:protein lin-52 homolog isoform X2 [Cygnus olor]|uniref:protein lin-52 homolog isoform X2 n=1 Tax=Cygnus atratus TaxID=8868 RepID=UPI0015D5D3DA|nr:protein lin-52 homolog isoform X2 [Cygnus atratus]XP_040415042.1 protein lin-52 homolog isoform X2 [Cygnus olor]